MGTTIGLVLNFLFVGILVIGFLIGLWRGFKKSSVNLAFSIVGIVIAFLITPLLASQVVNVTITINGVKQTLSEFIMNQISSGSDIGLMLQNNPSLEAVINKLPFALVSSIVFIVLTLVIEFIIYIIYKIIACIFLKTKPGKKKHRLLGGAVGTVRAFLLTIFAVMPLGSVIGLVDDLNRPEDIFVQTTVAEEYNGEREEPKGLLDRIEGSEQAIDVIQSINNSAFFKIGGLVGLDDQMFDYLSSFDVEGENVKIRQEIVTYATTANVVMQIQDELKAENPAKLALIDYEKLEIYVDKILDSKLFSTVVCDLASDIIKNYKDYSFASSFESVSEILDDIGNHLLLVERPSEYFSNDIKQFFNAFKNLAQNGALDDVIEAKNEEILKTIKILTSTDNFESTSKAIENIFSMNMVRDSVKTLTTKVLTNVLEGLEEIDASTEGYEENDWKTLSSQFSTLLKDATDAMDEIDLNVVLENPQNLVDPDDTTNLTKALTLVGKLIDDIRTIDLFKTSEGKSIIDKLLVDNDFTLPEGKVYDKNGNEVEIKTYSQMFAFLASPIEEIKKMDMHAFITGEIEQTPAGVFKLLADASMKQPEGEKDQYLGKILLPLTQIRFTEKLIFDEVLGNIAGEDNLVDFTLLTDYDSRKHDFKYINQLIIALNSDYDGNQSLLEALLADGEVDQAEILLQEGIDIKAIVKPILYANSTVGIRNKIFDSVDKATGILGNSNSKIERDKMIFEEGNPLDQADDFCDMLISMAKFYNTVDAGLKMADMDTTVLGAFLDEMRDYVIDSEGLEPVFEMLTTQLETEFDLTAKGIDINEFISSKEKSFVDLLNEAKSKL